MNTRLNNCRLLIINCIHYFQDVDNPLFSRHIEDVCRGLGGVVVIDAAIGVHGRGSRLAHYFTVAATLDKSLTSHCL